MLCIGHRGARGYAPENTLKSMAVALDMGTPWVEIDVYYVDNHVVVIHDERLERTTNGNGYIKERSFQYLRTLDAGDGEKIPTLDEVLDLICGRAGINIELKDYDAVGPVLEIIQKRVNRNWEINKFLVSSFNHFTLAGINKLDRRILIGLLLDGIPENYPSITKDLNAYSVNQSIEFIYSDFVMEAHDLGLKVFVYTVNEPDDIKRMEDMGVDGVFTDYPDRVLLKSAT